MADDPNIMRMVAAEGPTPADPEPTGGEITTRAALLVAGAPEIATVEWHGRTFYCRDIGGRGRARMSREYATCKRDAPAACVSPDELMPWNELFVLFGVCDAAGHRLFDPSEDNPESIADALDGDLLAALAFAIRDISGMAPDAVEEAQGN